MSLLNTEVLMLGPQISDDAIIHFAIFWRRLPVEGVWRTTLENRLYDYRVATDFLV
jgi:hypothetical protein